MAEDLQAILEKINREGIEKARAEADGILAAAKEEAAKIVADARSQAEKAKADAAKAAADYEARSAATVAQVARDTVSKVEGDVRALLERLLTRQVEKSLGEEATVAALVTEAVKGFAATGEIAIGPKLADALAASLKGLGAFTVVTDPTLDTGFSVKLEGGRVEHSFTGPVVAAEMARRLRPDLAALLKK